MTQVVNKETNCLRCGDKRHVARNFTKPPKMKATHNRPSENERRLMESNRPTVVFIQ